MDYHIFEIDLWVDDCRSIKFTCCTLTREEAVDKAREKFPGGKVVKIKQTPHPILS